MSSMTFDDELPNSLQYSSDSLPGLTRIKRRGKFIYLDSKGEQIEKDSVIARIQSLVIPPAWTSVWICPSSKGHLQVTGRDERGRKQAIYHPEWHGLRASQKFKHLREFGQALPKIRAYVDEQLASRGVSRDKILSAIVRLLETTMIRIGNQRYEEQNQSYGLTTLRNKHVRVIADRVEFSFKGKSNKIQQVTLKNRTLSCLVKKCQELPGQHLFSYLDSDGACHEVTSTEVNNFLQSISQVPITAKEFRTWGGTIEAMRLVREIQPTNSKDLTQIVKAVAQRLGNTPSVCRQHYIYPRVLDLDAQAFWSQRPLPRKRSHLDSIEALFLDEVLDEDQK
jgi:DNA topoisomerase-1